MTNITIPKAPPFVNRDSDPGDDPGLVLIGSAQGVTLPNHSHLDVLMQLPLPGIVIFVHGVNSDGEWYGQAEDGLCKGLNERLRRRNEDLAFPTPAGGQLKPAAYMPDLTADGYINPELTPKTFIERGDSFSPVIHFRWGYKAGAEELQKYGNGIYLNEQNYWGGGPFANGCTALPDLWGHGLSDDLFLWMHVQHLNPTNDRNVYSCPPRPYYVLAALRLARLVQSIRARQADVPVTIVCHSQGNMIGMCAAFLGDAMPDVTDAAGHTGRCVADSYVLCNAPYSLAQSNFTENFTQGHMTDRDGGTGRQSGAARIKTLAAFFKIVHRQAQAQMSPERIDTFMANAARGFTARADLDAYGLNGATYGRVTLYCNPHDQVISSTTVQGIGWRGLSAREIAATGGGGIFTQRVFAQGFAVGVAGQYHYWENHYKRPQPYSQAFWFPESLTARYSVAKGLDASGGLGKVLTVMTAPLAIVSVKLAGTRINALPDKDWQVPLNAPDLPAPFLPESLRFGQSSTQFDQGYDAPGESRDKERVRDADDPYAGDRSTSKGGSDAAAGDRDSEAALRYEDHARLRMQARREGLAKQGEPVAEEDNLATASAAYKAWRGNKIKTNLADNIDTHATDHSTIMTNAMHAQKALAYDVAIGNCHLLEEDLHKMRVAADWRFLDGLGDDNSNSIYFEYFDSGKLKGKSLFEWAHHDAEGKMPGTITDEREDRASKHKRHGGRP